MAVKSVKRSIKRVFISQPMHGLTDEEVEKLRNETINRLKEYYGEIEIIDQFHVEDNIPEGVNPRIYRLGRSIQYMAGADLVVFVGDYASAHGCLIELAICEEYRISYIKINPNGKEYTRMHYI